IGLVDTGDREGTAYQFVDRIAVTRAQIEQGAGRRARSHHDTIDRIIHIEKIALRAQIQNLDALDGFVDDLRNNMRYDKRWSLSRTVYVGQPQSDDLQAVSPGVKGADLLRGQFAERIGVLRTDRIRFFRGHREVRSV